MSLLTEKLFNAFYTFDFCGKVPRRNALEVSVSLPEVMEIQGNVKQRETKMDGAMYRVICEQKLLIQIQKH